MNMTLIWLMLITPKNIWPTTLGVRINSGCIILESKLLSRWGEQVEQSEELESWFSQQKDPESHENKNDTDKTIVKMAKMLSIFFI